MSGNEASDALASLPKDAIEEFSAYFDKESLEMQLLEMETSMLNDSAEKIDAVQGLFRDIHSLKGSSAMLNVDTMTHLLHSVEDVLGVITSNCHSIKGVKRTDIFDFFLQAFDLTERLINVLHDNPGFVLKDSRELFGFYIRVIVEARDIAKNIDIYFDISELNESIF